MDRIKLAHEVLDLVFKANGGFVERAGEQEPTGEPTAFFMFSGHCPSVDVSIFPNGWHRDADYAKDRVEFTFPDWHEDKELEEELNRLREYVEELTRRNSMIKVTLKQGYNNIELEYDTIEAVEELIRVVGSGQEIENLTVMIGLANPKEDED